MTVKQLKELLERFSDDTLIGYEADEVYEVEWFEEYEGEYVDEDGEDVKGKLIKLI